MTIDELLNSNPPFSRKDLTNLLEALSADFRNIAFFILGSPLDSIKGSILYLFPSSVVCKCLRDSTRLFQGTHDSFSVFYELLRD
ncbi:hypothetical protein M3J09_010664 [Ascochyta lentis]